MPCQSLSQESPHTGLNPQWRGLPRATPSQPSHSQGILLGALLHQELSLQRMGFGGHRSAAGCWPWAGEPCARHLVGWGGGCGPGGWLGAGRDMVLPIRCAWGRRSRARTVELGLCPAGELGQDGCNKSRCTWWRQDPPGRGAAIQEELCRQGPHSRPCLVLKMEPERLPCGPAAPVFHDPECPLSQPQ